MSTQCHPHTAHLARSDLSKQFVADIRGRFRPIRGRVRHFVGEADGFNLRREARTAGPETARLQDGDDEPEGWPDPPPTVPPDASTARLTDEFVEWLRNALREDVLEPVDMGTEARVRRASTDRDIRNALVDWDHWTAEYIRAAFRSAWELAGGRLRVRGGTVAPTALDTDTALTEAFDIGVEVSTLRDLYLQAYDGLRTAVNDANAQQVRETITQGFAEGRGPRDIAADLTRDIRSLQRRRAETHVRTVTMHTRTQSTLQRYQAAGESVVSHVEFDDSGDSRVCPFCRRLNGVEMTIDEMLGTHVLWRGDIYRLAPPAHASGRCLPLPSVGADAPTEPLADRVPGTIVTTTANPHALSQ